MRTVNRKQTYFLPDEPNPIRASLVPVKPMTEKYVSVLPAWGSGLVDMGKLLFRSWERSGAIFYFQKWALALKTTSHTRGVNRPSAPVATQQLEK